MNYQLFFEQPSRQLIRTEIHLQPAGQQKINLQLSRWRPGRYEFAPYAEKIVDVHAFRPESKETVAMERTGTNNWLLVPGDAENVVVEYKFHANTLDAGGSFLDDQLIYFNPINFILHDPEKMDQPCTLKLHIPADFQVASSLEGENGQFFLPDMHTLLDTPVLAAPDLQHTDYSVDGVKLNCWFQGPCKPDMERVKNDFIRFSDVQFALFGDFPVKEYHFLFLTPHYKKYHGVEHQASTVIVLGPGHRLMSDDLYKEFLGVSSHELFHTWNVKAIRPADMQPYKYEQENYSKLHYVTEGVTTYYGDLMLLKSGIWDLNQFCDVFSQSNLVRHYRTDGGNHISLEQASFESWAGGYSAGVPNRKISFYSKGALVAFLLDVEIRKATANAFSLDDLMFEMYQQFGKTGKGYTKADYKGIAEKVSGLNLDYFFTDYISGTKDLVPALSRAAEYLGLEIYRMPHQLGATRDFGIYLEKNGDFAVVKNVAEGSSADLAGLAVGDQLNAVNGLEVKADTVKSVFEMLGTETLRLHVFRSGRLLNFELKPNPEGPLTLPFLIPGAAPSTEQLENRRAWIEVKDKRKTT